MGLVLHHWRLRLIIMVMAWLAQAWRKPVNEALLTLRESGIYDAIYAKWFSVTQSAARP